MVVVVVMVVVVNVFVAAVMEEFNAA